MTRHGRSADRLRGAGMRARGALLVALGVALSLGGLAGTANGDLAVEVVGKSLSLPAEPGAHWIWASDMLLDRAALFDADSGEMMGMLSTQTNVSPPAIVRSRDGRELYVAEVHYARGTRGARTDTVTIYDAVTLSPRGEVVVPPKLAEHASGVGNTALSDDGRFLAVFNQSPATSISIVDVTLRTFVGEIDTPGCSLVYPAGPRRFAMLCGNGELLWVALDKTGALADRTRHGPFFDPEADPITEKAARIGDVWYFVSFAGVIHSVDVSGAEPAFGETWSAADAGWRPGGQQLMAAHPGTKRLYLLMHEGGEGTHKDAGTEVWVFDVESRARLERIATGHPLAVYMGQAMGAPPGSITRWLMGQFLPNPGVDRILVTDDPEPVLLVGAFQPSTVLVFDALSGEHLRDLTEVGIVLGLLGPR